MSWHQNASRSEVECPATVGWMDTADHRKFSRAWWDCRVSTSDRQG